ncbi:MAG: hypothetical protein L0I76_36965 [Pseudonocardia sp.]|nr:hypothetical protein [Pseudonocardia sp.]
MPGGDLPLGALRAAGRRAVGGSGPGQVQLGLQLPGRAAQAAVVVVRPEPAAGVLPDQNRGDVDVVVGVPV